MVHNMTKLVNELSRHLDKGSICLDLSMAFDTIDYDILLKHVDSTGLGG